MDKKFSRWLVITIPTSHLIFLAAGIVIVALGVIVVIYGNSYMEGKHASKAKIAIAKAEQLLVETEKKHVPDFELNSTIALLDRAKNLMKMKDYRFARQSAEEAVERLEFLLATFKPIKGDVSGRYARITEIHGTVEILKQGQVDWTQVGLNTVIQSGTKIRTGQASTAKLQFDDNSTVQMKANSLILIRELTEDEHTKAVSSNIELGVSEIEALIPEPKIRGSQFLITMPDKSMARIQSESSLSVKVNKQKRGVIKVFIGQVDILSGERKIALKTREAIILDPKRSKRARLKPIAIPLAPVLIYPTNVQLFSIAPNSNNPIFFRWTTIKDAKEYRLEIARDYYFYEKVYDKTMKSNKAKIYKLKAGNYYWHVSSINALGLSSEPSPFNSFRIAMPQDLDTASLDLTPPEIKIERITLLGHIVDVVGRTESNASLFVNEQQETVHEDGTFRALVEFNKPGPQELFIEVYDANGNVSSLRKIITIPETTKNR